MNDTIPLYSSRVTKNYLEYLKKARPEIKVEPILKYAGMTRFEIEDPGHWFSQQQVDRFNEILAQKTGDAAISRKVGRYIASAKGLGPVKQTILGLMNPTTVYQLMGKLYPMLSRAADVETKKLGINKVEITNEVRLMNFENLFHHDRELFYYFIEDI